MQWLRDNAVAVRSIAPDDEDFSDLMPLREKIGAARMVLLGEQTHGDGATFLAKSRLVRFLHQHMGFDVLAWESGIFDCRQVDAALRSGAAGIDAARAGVFGIWSLSEQCQSVFDYATRTSSSARPLEMAGFDCQITGAPLVYHDYIVGLVDALQPEALSADDRSLLQQWMERSAASKPTRNADEAAAVSALLQRIGQIVDTAASGAVLSTRERDFARRCILNLQSLQIVRDAMDDTGPSDAAVLERDTTMGENLIWLANHRYRGRKIIVWAASSHIARAWRGVEPADERLPDSQLEYVPMGEHVAAELGDEIYVMGFIAHDGEYGTLSPQPRRLEPSPVGSLDRLLYETGQPYLFLDLKTSPPSWLQEALVARPFGYASFRARWPEIFDGFFFTAKMQPSTRDPQAPPRRSRQ